MKKRKWNEKGFREKQESKRGSCEKTGDAKGGK